MAGRDRVPNEPSFIQIRAWERRRGHSKSECSDDITGTLGWFTADQSLPSYCVGRKPWQAFLLLLCLLLIGPPPLALVQCLGLIKGQIRRPTVGLPVCWQPLRLEVLVLTATSCLLRCVPDGAWLAPAYRAEASSNVKVTGADKKESWWNFSVWMILYE